MPKPVESAVVQPVESAPRGRPRIHEDDNARKLAHKREKKDPERQKMIRSVWKKVRQLMAKPMWGHVRYWKMLHQDKKYLDGLKVELMALPYADIKKYYDRLVSKDLGIFDGTGRLPDERSGEASQSQGTSEIEKIFAAVQRETDSSMPARPVSTSNVAAEEDEPVARGATRPRAPDDWYTEENLFERAAQVLAEQQWEGSQVYDGEQCDSVSQLAERIIRGYRKTEENIRFYHQMRNLFIGEGALSATYEDSPYYQILFDKVEELRQADKDEGAKARRIARLAREGKAERVFTSPPTNPL